MDICDFLDMILSRVTLPAIWPPYEGRDDPQLKGAGVDIFLQVKVGKWITPYL